MVITPTMLIAGAYAGPVVVSTIFSYFVGRLAAGRKIEQLREEMEGSTTSAVQAALHALHASADQIEDRVERSRVTAQEALEKALEAKAVTGESVSRARAAMNLAEDAAGKVQDASKALNELLANAQVSAAQIGELLQLAREQALTTEWTDDKEGAQSSSSGQSTASARDQRPAPSRRQRRRAERQQPVLNGASTGTADAEPPL